MTTDYFYLGEESENLLIFVICLLFVTFKCLLCKFCIHILAEIKSDLI